VGEQSATSRGLLVGIFVADIGGAPMRPLEAAHCQAGAGIDGDRYATGRGFYSPRPRLDRQVTLIEAEMLDWLSQEHGIALSGEETRRNLVTRGIALSDLVGHLVRVGDVLLRVSRINEPCAYWQNLLGKPVLEPMVHRSGINCEILRGGWLRAGDEIWRTDTSAESIR
jgi:hypothetical protein